MSGAIAITNSPVFLSSPMFCEPMISPREGSNTSTSVLSKRKRPAKIQIPFEPLSFVDEVGKREDDMAEIYEEGEEYSVYCKRGQRRFMEDRYTAIVNLQGDSKQAFFGVFDGHGGAKAAEFSAKNLHRSIISKVANKCEDEIVEAIREGYLATDSEFLEQDVNGGACCVTALIRNGKLIVSNVGDCRAVMSRGGVAEALTDDHKPSRKDEQDRIQRMGGYVDSHNGVWRIQGSLAVSRGIGDKHLKKWVIAEPETRVINIKPECEFVILASDGLWDKVNNQEAVDIVRPFCVGIKNPDPISACTKLVGLSATRGSYDDTSIMIIQLPHFVS